MIETFDINHWQEKCTDDIQMRAVNALEDGKVLYFPQLPFSFLENETAFLSSGFVNPKTKNISYNIHKDDMRGAMYSQNEHVHLKQLMQRYAIWAQQFINTLFPHYCRDIQPARTSFRPVEISGRVSSSYRKDDTRLHVDAFPSTPMQGKRILRIFTNVNNENKERVWRLGAPFAKVLEHFLPQLNKPFSGSAFMLHALKITKTRRSLYDHYMLQLHNVMKADLEYQKQVSQMEFRFPAGSTWIVYTDQVSHAAMSGQHVLEQTFYLPIHAMVNKDRAPLKILEQRIGIDLVDSI